MSDDGGGGDSPQEHPADPFRDRPAPGGPPPGGPYLAGPPGPEPPGHHPPPQAGRYPTGPVPSGAGGPGHPPGGPYPGQHPSGQYPADPVPPGAGRPGLPPGGPYPEQHPSGQYPAGPVPPGAGRPGLPPGGPYPGQHPSGQYPAGAVPPGGQYPGQYPSGQHPAGAVPPGGQYPGQYPAGPVPPGYPPGAGGPPDYLGPGYGVPPGPPPRRRRRGLPWIVTAAVTTVLLSAGGVTAYTLLAGQSIALDRRVPADAVVFAELSLDPPAGQKVAALRFFKHLPNVQIREDSRDLVEGLIEPLLDTTEAKQKFEADVKPWLGEHIAFAVDTQGTAGEPIAVVESTDANKARAGMDALLQDATVKIGYVVSGGLVVVARSQAVAQAALDDAKRGSLHGNPTFRKDVKTVGDDGVFTAWTDLSKASELDMVSADTGGAPSSGTTPLHGRVAASLRFTATTADLLVRGIGLDQAAVTGEPAGPRLGALPEDTAFGLALSGADKAVKQAYDAAESSGLGDALHSLQDNTGLVLPDDLAALVGSSTVAAVSGTADKPEYGLISRTDDVDAARTAAQRLLRALGDDARVVVRPVSNGTVIASSSGYADRLASPGTLGSTELFRTALPDLAGSQFAFFANVRRAAELSDSPPDSPEAQVRAVGVTVGTGAGTATVHARVVVG